MVGLSLRSDTRTPQANVYYLLFFMFPLSLSLSRVLQNPTDALYSGSSPHPSSTRPTENHPRTQFFPVDDENNDIIHRNRPLNLSRARARAFA